VVEVAMAKPIPTTTMMMMKTKSPKIAMTHHPQKKKEAPNKQPSSPPSSKTNATTPCAHSSRDTNHSTHPTWDDAYPCTCPNLPPSPMKLPIFEFADVKIHHCFGWCQHVRQ